MGASELRVASVQYVQAYDFLFFVAYSYRVADAVASAATVRASVSGLRSRPRARRRDRPCVAMGLLAASL